MKQNKTLRNIEIQKIGYGGVGIVKMEDGKTLLVKGGVLPGMIVDVKITKRKKDYLEGQVIKIVNSEKGIINSVEVFEQLKNGNQPLDLGEVKLCRHNFVLEQMIKEVKGGNKDNLGLSKENTSNQQSPKSPHNPQIHVSPKSPSNPQISIGCGGCKWQILPYEEQLKLKEDVVKDSFAGIDFFDDVYEGIVPAENIFNYRNKMEFSFGKLVTKVDGKAKVISDWNLGFHKQGQFSKVIDVSSCLIGGKKINEIYTYLKNILKNCGLPVYDNYDHSGFFRHLVIREGFNTGQVLVNLSVATKFFDKNKDKINLWTSLQQKFYDDKYLRENITTFVITENNGLADVVKGSDIKVSNLWGGGHIFEKLVFNNDFEGGRNDKERGNSHAEFISASDAEDDNDLGGNKYNLGLSPNNQSPKSPQNLQIHVSPKSPSNPQISITFRISAFSFFQTNTLQAQKLFQTAIDMLPSIKGNILDLYCGAGTIGLTLLKLGIGEKLLGVEIVKDAVIDANANAKLNGLSSKAQFIADKAENINFDAQDIGLVVVDPPRSGLHKNVIEFLANLKKIYNFTLLYISCNPVTIARDLRLLTEKGFKVKKLRAVDMFPHTHHIEIIGIAS